MTIEPLLRTRTGLTGARLPLLRTFTLLSATLLLVANAYAEPSATIQEIKRRGRLVVAMVADSHYPFFYEDETGQLRGADVDLAEGIANALGVELVLSRERTTFDGVIDQVANGAADVGISMLSVTLARAEVVLFTHPYVTQRQALLINRVRSAATKQKMENPVTFLNDLGQKVGILGGTSYARFAGDLFPGAEIVALPDRPSLFTAVQRGDLLAAHIDENLVKQFIFEDPRRLVDLQVEILQDYEDLIAMTVPLQSVHFKEWLNTYLRVNRVNWTLDELLERYPRPRH